MTAITNAAAETAVPAVLPATLQGYRLSPQQRRVWQQQETGFSGFAQVVWRITGALRPDLLSRALRQAMTRQQILRTTFHRLPGMTLPVQVINERMPLPWEVRELAARQDERESLVTEAQANEQQRLYDADRGPLWRALLLSFSGQENFLLLTSSLLVADQRTLNLLAGELAQDCAAAAWDGQAEEEELTQYVQFAEWQNDLLETLAESGESEARWPWQRENPSGESWLKLPGESFSPISAAPLFASFFRDVPPATAATVDAFCRRQNVARESCLLACLATLVSRYGASTEVFLGWQADGRSVDELQSACGPYAKILPLFFQLDAARSFADFLCEVEAQRQATRARQDEFFWEQLPSAVATAWPFWFAFHRAGEPPLPIAGEPRFSVWRQAGQPEPGKLGLAIDASMESWRLCWHYDTRFLPAAVVERIAEGFEALLNDALQRPAAAIGALSVIGAQQRQQLLTSFNQTAADYPREQCIHHLIEAQAREHPQRIAVQSAASGDTAASSLSYAELNARANQLARRLQALGVGPETIVGVCVERAPEMLVGILAILKAGGAYLPLNPDLPPERLAFIVNDAGANILLTKEHLRARLPQAPRVLCLERIKYADAEAAPLPSEVNASHLAYVIYTSGSTGQPKGVLVTHRNLVHSTTARLRYYRAPITNFMLVSPFAFDSSIAGIFGTLCQGGTLTLAPENFQQDVNQFAALLDALQVSHLLCIPSLYQALLDPLRRHALSALRTVIVAGESCARRLVNRHHELFPQVTLCNEYGPTEVSVWSTVEECLPAAAEAPVLIGRPITNTQAYLLDERGQLSPLGALGELYLGGEGVARGYLRRPELTAEKFVPHPFSTQPGARLYRTGDLARFTADGKLEFLGRRDGQIKLRGFRIELEEIENTLRQHPALQDAVVAVKPLAVSSAVEPDGLADAKAEIDLARLVAELEALSENEAELALQAGPRAENNNAASVNRRVRRASRFELSLELKDDAFIRPPRDTQREWLLNKALSEFAEDLSQLDRLAARFVPGAATDWQTLARDRSQVALSAQEIMEDWQIPVLRVMAETVGAQAGHILEIGFGRGISASLIQQYDVASHTIIECNEHVVEHYFRPWQQRYPARDIRLCQAKWQDVTAQLGIYDAILFHAYPLTPHEVQQNAAGVATFAGDFFAVAAAHLQPNGVFTYLSHEMDSLSRRHQRLLLTHFRSFSVSVMPLELPADCRDWWWADVMAIVTARK